MVSKRDIGEPHGENTRLEAEIAALQNELTVAKDLARQQQDLAHQQQERLIGLEAHLTQISRLLRLKPNLTLIADADPNKLYSIKDVSKITGLEGSTLRRLSGQRGFGRKVGERGWVYTKEDIEAIIGREDYRRTRHHEHQKRDQQRRMAKNNDARSRES